MQGKASRIAVLISALFLLGSLLLMGPVSAEEEIDNRPDSDACPNTTHGEVVDQSGCSNTDQVDPDDDLDGIVNSYDACPNTHLGESVNLVGCLVESVTLDGSQTGSPLRNDSNPASYGSEPPSWLYVLIFAVVFGAVYYIYRANRSRKEKMNLELSRLPTEEQRFIPVPRQSSHQEIQAQQLQQQLAQQAQQTQHLQHQLKESKASLEKEIKENSKATTVVQNITYNIQDSATGDLNANLNAKNE